MDTYVCSLCLTRRYSRSRLLRLHVLHEHCVAWHRYVLLINCISWIFTNHEAVNNSQEPQPLENMDFEPFVPQDIAIDESVASHQQLVDQAIQETLLYFLNLRPSDCQPRGTELHYIQSDEISSSSSPSPAPNLNPLPAHAVVGPNIISDTESEESAELTSSDEDAMEEGEEMVNVCCLCVSRGYTRSAHLRVHVLHDHGVAWQSYSLHERCLIWVITNQEAINNFEEAQPVPDLDFHLLAVNSAVPTDPPGVPHDQLVEEAIAETLRYYPSMRRRHCHPRPSPGHLLQSDEISSTMDHILLGPAVSSDTASEASTVLLSSGESSMEEEV